MPNRTLKLGEYYFLKDRGEITIVMITSLLEDSSECHVDILDLMEQGQLLDHSIIMRDNIDLTREVTPDVLERATKQVVASFQAQVDQFWSKSEQ